MACQGFAAPPPAQQLAELEQAINQQQLYNQFRQAQVEALQQEEQALVERLAALRSAREQIEPLLYQEWQRAWHQLARDMPFYLQTRQAAWQNIQPRLLAPDRPLAERAALLLEQLQQEDDYGQQISRYRGSLPMAPDRQLAFVRVGRLAWCGQQLDGQAAWCWQSGQWQTLPSPLVPALSRLVVTQQSDSWLALSAVPLTGAVEAKADE